MSGLANPLSVICLFFSLSLSLLLRMSAISPKFAAVAQSPRSAHRAKMSFEASALRTYSIVSCAKDMTLVNGIYLLPGMGKQVLTLMMPNRFKCHNGSIWKTIVNVVTVVSFLFLFSNGSIVVVLFSICSCVF